MRSIPEKTLEHWVSIYLSNRFPDSSMWWPAVGEDILVPLVDLAGAGAGKTLALELKTTEVTRSGHELAIDVQQLRNYLWPGPGSPPLPVYYVFPLPHWSGGLRAGSGQTPTAPGGKEVAPPAWWRQRAGTPWFGGWLYVMPARSLAAALPQGWETSARVRLYSVPPRDVDAGPPAWSALFDRTPPGSPRRWTSFWQTVVQCGPGDGVRWRTTTVGEDLPSRLDILDGEDRQEWPWQEALIATPPARPTGADTAPEGGQERVLVRIPEHRLRDR